jgi:hypothetical protein
MRNGQSAGARWGRWRLARKLGLDHNPLRRRSDILAIRIFAGLLAVLLICGPLLAVGAFRWAAQAGAREQHQQQAWRQVTATLLRPDSGDALAAAGGWAQARWTAPDGQPRLGNVPVLRTDWAGSTVRLWVDRDGWPTGRPLSGRQLTDRPIGAGILAVAALAMLLSGLGWLAHCLIDRRRLAGWDAAWASIGPSWTRRGQQ